MNVREMTNEQLAAVIRAIRITGITPSTFEQECLEEAARRLEDNDGCCET